MEASVTLDFSYYSKNLLDILEVFQKIGWSIYNSYGEIEYLLFGDNGNYDWKREKMSAIKFYQIVMDKTAAKEQVGVNLFYNDGKEGVSFLAYDTNQVILSLSINRRISNGKGHTDMNWYLENIVYKFFDFGVKLFSYQLEELLD